MAIDLKIDQVRATQLIAESPPFLPGTPGKLFVVSNKTEGTEQYNGVITDQGFINDATGEDVFFVVSGSKFNVREPNNMGSNSGVALFTGDVVISGSLVVSTDQLTNYSRILAQSSSFFGNQNIDFGINQGAAILNTMAVGNNNLQLINGVYNSFVAGNELLTASDIRNTSIQGSAFSTMENNIIGCSFIGVAFSGFDNVFQSGYMAISNGSYKGTQLFSSIADYNVKALNSGFAFSAGNYLVTMTESENIISLGNSLSGFNEAGSLTAGIIAIGNYAAAMELTSKSMIIGSNNARIEYNGNCSIIGGENVYIGTGVDNSHALFAYGATIAESNRIIIGNELTKTAFSGSIVANNGISGSLQFLPNGYTRAFSTYVTTPGPTHIVTSSSGQINFGTFTRLPLGNYISSTATSSIPEVAGSCYFNRYEHEDFRNILDNPYARFRCVLSTATNTTTASVKLYNVTLGAYVAIGGPGVYTLSTTSSTPEVLISQNLDAIGNNFSIQTAVYETHIYISGSGLPAVVNHHSSELLFAPRIKTGYSS